jgi:hypothetical protein
LVQEGFASQVGPDWWLIRVQLSGRQAVPVRGAKWFSFDLSVDPAHPMALVVSYNHDEWQERKFEVLVDGVRVGEQTIERRGPTRFLDVEYAVPSEVLKGKQKVTVRFQADSGSEIGAVFGIRMIRADAER